MFTALAQAKPTHLIIPGATKTMGHAWYISTVTAVRLSCKVVGHRRLGVFQNGRVGIANPWCLQEGFTKKASQKSLTRKAVRAILPFIAQYGDYRTY
jgi:hypothetical protein